MKPKQTQLESADPPAGDTPARLRELEERVRALEALIATMPEQIIEILREIKE